MIAPLAGEECHRQRRGVGAGLLRLVESAAGGSEFHRLGGSIKEPHDREVVDLLLSLAGITQEPEKLSKSLLTEFGSASAVLSAPPSRVLKLPGSTKALAAAITLVRSAVLCLLRREIVDRPLLNNWTALLDYLHADMAHRRTECFRVLFLDQRYALIRDEVLFEGTVGEAPVYTREIIGRALDLGASTIILVHNHPSGTVTPSLDDIAATNEIVEAGRFLGVSVHDHIVVGLTGHASFRELGLLKSGAR